MNSIAPRSHASRMNKLTPRPHFGPHEMVKAGRQG